MTLYRLEICPITFWTNYPTTSYLPVLCMTTQGESEKFDLRMQSRIIKIGHIYHENKTDNCLIHSVDFTRVRHDMRLSVSCRASQALT